MIRRAHHIYRSLARRDYYPVGFVSKLGICKHNLTDLNDIHLRRRFASSYIPLKFYMILIFIYQETVPKCC